MHRKLTFLSLAAALQTLGSSAEYVTLETTGANALDFHIAYYIGVLSSQDPSAFFHVISKDTGFDPLIKHLKGMPRTHPTVVCNLEDDVAVTVTPAS